MSCCLGRRHAGRRINLGAPEVPPEPTPYYGPGAPGYDYTNPDDLGAKYVDTAVYPDYVVPPTAPSSNKGLMVGGALLGLAALLAAFG